MSENNPLAVMGWCEVRAEGVPFPRRSTVMFEGAVLLDLPDRTVVTPAPSAAPLTAALGVGATPGNEGGGVQYYDERGGEWFGAGFVEGDEEDPEFSAAEVVQVHTEFPEGISEIQVSGFGADPAAHTKTLVNLGPDPFWLVNRDTSHEGALRVVGESFELLPNLGVRLFWDPFDSFWRVVTPPVKAGPGEFELVLGGEPLVIAGEPIIITPGG